MLANARDAREAASPMWRARGRRGPRSHDVDNRMAKPGLKSDRVTLRAQHLWPGTALPIKPIAPRRGRAPNFWINSHLAR
jgi:hypothetical protein